MITLMAMAAYTTFLFKKRRASKKSAKGQAIAAAVLALVVCLAVLPGSAGAGPEAPPSVPTYGYFDFPTCVRYALVHSPLLLKSRIDIQVKSIDLKDAHSEVLPTVELITRYYFIRADHRNPFNVEMFISDWNPYLALLKIKSQKIMVDIAALNHMDKISEAVSEMARLFYRVHMAERGASVRSEMIKVRDEKVKYAEKKAEMDERTQTPRGGQYSGIRRENGHMWDLEVELLKNARDAERLKLQDATREKQQATAELKKIMGYPPDHELPLDTRDAVNQILDGFNWQMITFTDVQTLSKPLKILAKQEQLQSNYVTSAYVDLVPKPMVVMEGLSNQPDRTSGFNMAVGFNYTLWDGFKKVRQIKRQKLKAQVAAIDREDRSQELYNRYRKLRADLMMMAEKDSVLRKKVALSEESQQKAERMFEQGNGPDDPKTRVPGIYPGNSQKRDQTLPRDLYGNKLDMEFAKLEAKMEAVGVAQDRVMALIDLATVAGGLERYNARIRY